MRRVADLSVSCHCIIRDRLNRRALVLDICLLVGSLLVTVLALASPDLIRSLMRGSVQPSTLIGIVGLVIFALSIVSIRVDWKHRGALHGEAAKEYASLKLEVTQMLANSASQTQARFDTLQAEYRMTSMHSIPVSENDFSKLKKKHLTKLALSKMLDSKPGSSLLLARIRLWWRDNF